MLSVYFIQAGADGPIKIGVTGDDPQRRLAQLQVASPFELRLLLACPITDEKVERELHSRFASGRLKGEWFQVTTSGLLDLIDRLHAEVKPIVPYAQVEARAMELARHGNWEAGLDLLFKSPLKISPEDQLFRR